MPQHTWWTHNIDPVAFNLGGAPISWYWLFYPLGFTAVALLSLWHRKALKVNALALTEAFTWAWLGVLLGSRTGYLLFYNREVLLSQPESVWQVWLGGMSFHGGLLGASLALLFWARWKHEKLLPHSDLILTFTPLALFLGRLGNFVNGELYGRVTDVPWAIIYPQSGNLSPRHPSQIYQALLEGLLLFFILYWGRRRLWATPGMSTALFFTLYGLFRITGELFRQPDPQVGFLWGGTTLGQWLSALMMLSGIFMLIFFLRPQQAQVEPRQSL